VRLSASRRARDHPLFPRPRLARGRRAGRGARLCIRLFGQRAAAAHRQVISLAYLPIALFLLSRALDRSSWRYGALAGVAAGLIVTGRDQVALLEIYVLAGFVLAHWCGDGFLSRLRASVTPLIA